MKNRNYNRRQSHDYRNTSGNRHLRYAVDRKHSNKSKVSVFNILGVGTAFIITTYGLVNVVPSMFSSKKVVKPVVETSIVTEAPEHTESTLTVETEPTIQTKPTTEPENTIETKPAQEPVVNTIFTIGGNGDEEVKDFLGSESDGEYNADGSINAGYYVYKYSEDYGVDPNIIASMCYQESGCDHYSYCPDGDLYSGFAVGIMQLESPSYDDQSATKVTAYNYTTGESDTVAITMDNACSIETNIQIGCMLFQNSIEYFEGNLPFAIQSHNYSQGMVELVIYSNYSNYDSLKRDYPGVVQKIKDQYPKSYNEIFSSLADYWDIVRSMINQETTTVPLDVFYDAHNNPLKYISNWSYKKFGDGEYIEHVLSHCPQNIVKYRTSDYEYTANMENMELLEKLSIGGKAR